MKANALLLTLLITIALFAFTSPAFKKRFKSIQSQNSRNTEQENSDAEAYLSSNSTTKDFSNHTSENPHFNHRPNRQSLQKRENKNKTDKRNHDHDQDHDHEHKHDHHNKHDKKHKKQHGNNHEHRHKKEHHRKKELKAFFKSILEHFSNYTMRQIFNETNFHAEFSGDNKTHVFNLNGTEVDFLEITLREFESLHVLVFVDPDGRPHNVTSKQIEEEFERAFIEGFESGMNENENQETSVEFIEKKHHHEHSQASDSLNNLHKTDKKHEHGKEENNHDQDEDEEDDEEKGNQKEEVEEQNDEEDDHEKDDHEQNRNPLLKRHGKDFHGQESINSSEI